MPTRNDGRDTPNSELAIANLERICRGRSAHITPSTTPAVSDIKAATRATNAIRVDMRYFLEVVGTSAKIKAVSGPKIIKKNTQSALAITDRLSREQASINAQMVKMKIKNIGSSWKSVGNF